MSAVMLNLLFIQCFRFPHDFLQLYVGFLNEFASRNPRKATKVEGQRGKSLDFPGATTTTHRDTQQSPGTTTSAATTERTRWVPSYSRSTYRDENELVFRRVRG